MQLADARVRLPLKFFRSRKLFVDGRRPLPAACPSCLRTDATYCGVCGALEDAGFGLFLGSPTTETAPFRPEEVFVGPGLFFGFLRLGRRGRRPEMRSAGAGGTTVPEIARQRRKAAKKRQRLLANESETGPPMQPSSPSQVEHLLS